MDRRDIEVLGMRILERMLLAMEGDSPFTYLGEPVELQVSVHTRTVSALRGGKSYPFELRVEEPLEDPNARYRVEARWLWEVDEVPFALSPTSSDEEPEGYDSEACHSLHPVFVVLDHEAEPPCVVDHNGIPQGDPQVSRNWYVTRTLAGIPTWVLNERDRTL